MLVKFELYAFKVIFQMSMFKSGFRNLSTEKFNLEDDALDYDAPEDDYGRLSSSGADDDDGNP